MDIVTEVVVILMEMAIDVNLGLKKTAMEKDVMEMDME